MMKSVGSSTINGTLTAPASKSYMQRAVAIALLTQGTTRLLNPSEGEDSLHALKIAEKLGVQIEKESPSCLALTSSGSFTGSSTICCGESGLLVRLFSAICALSSQSTTLQGEGTLLKRPINMVIPPLQDLGVQCQSQNGFLPLTIQGPLQGGRQVNVSGAVSSQFLSGLLIALPTLAKDTRILVDQLKSLPYIDMTLDIMEKFGVTVTHENYEIFPIRGGQKYLPQTYMIESDWSGVAFLLVAGAVAGEVTVELSHLRSKQADRSILDALKQAGAEVEERSSSIHVSKKSLRGFQFDASQCPDLFPPLVALAAHCKGPSHISGVHRLKHKESDRATALQTEFEKMGVKISMHADQMVIEGGKAHGGATTHSHHDHRIAMALAVAALGLSLKKESSLKKNNMIAIDHTECVRKSYPDFFEDIKHLGACVYE